MDPGLDHHAKIKDFWAKPPKNKNKHLSTYPSKVAVDIAAWALGIGLGAVTALYIMGEANGGINGPGGLALAITRSTGLLATYMIILVVLLAARINLIERSVGQDTLVKWHRKLAPYALVLLTAHVFLSIYGYAKLPKLTFFKQFTTFILHYPDMLTATVGYILLIVAGITSYKRVRSKIKYETWWTVHMYTYLGVALSVSHQIRLGVMFTNHPLAKDLWVAAFIVLLEVVLWNRILVALFRNIRHQLRVEAVVEEAPGVYSVTFKGKKLEKLAVSGGQFIQWRFLTKGLFLHSHPYSISAMPRPPYIRITVKDLGDHSGLISKLSVGTRVFIEGPYGSFTRHRTASKKVTLIAAGVGVTPIRAILEDISLDVETNVILRGSTKEDMIHNREIAAIMAHRHGKFYEITGSRSKATLGPKDINNLIPDALNNDYFICGPEGFNTSMRENLVLLGVDSDKIHIEEFSF